MQWLQSAQARADCNLKTAFQSAILKIKKTSKSANSAESSLEIVDSDIYQTSEPKGNILIVDDFIENLHILTEILSKQGYKELGELMVDVGPSWGSTLRQ